MDDGVSVELVHGSHDALLEFLFGCDSDVAQDRAGELGEETLDEIEPGAVLGREGEFESTVTGTAAPPRLWRSAERDSHFDLLMRGALIPCIRPGMMPTLISVSR